MEQKNKKIISILVEDEFGALSRIIELFGSRGYNLHSICSGEARKKGLQRLTLVCCETDKNIKQIIKLLRNIIYIHDAKIESAPNSSSTKIEIIFLFFCSIFFCFSFIYNFNCCISVL